MIETQLQQAVSNALKVFTPPSTEPLDVWAEKNFYLSPETSALPGLISFKDNAFQRGMLEAIGDVSYRKIVIEASSQVAKTQSLLVFLAWMIPNDPGPCLVVQPTDVMATSFSKDRVLPMFRDNPVLEGKLSAYRKLGAGNTTKVKSFPGGSINFASAGSPASLSSRPIRYLLLDEIDREVSSGNKEGHWVDVASARTTTYSCNHKIIMVSSPAEQTTSRIHKEYLAGDQRKFWVPCFHCGTEQILEFQNVRWEAGDFKTTRYVCPHCHEKISEGEKRAMIRDGRWIAANPASDTPSFHISSLYSSFVTMEQLARQFAACKNNPDQLRVFLNTKLAQPWNAKAESIDDIDFLMRLESRQVTDPISNNVVMITAGCDVQKDRLEMQIIGHGTDEQMWVLGYHVIPGGPNFVQTWQEFRDLTKQKFIREDGAELEIAVTCVDGGYALDDVLRATEKMQRVYVTRGRFGNYPIWPKTASRSNRGGFRFYNIGVDTIKEKLFDQIRIEQVGTGYVHFPSDIIDIHPTYFDQLSAEKLQITFKKGKEQKNWVMEHGTRNEALDTFVYAVAAKYSLSVVNLKAREERLKKQVEGSKVEAPDPLIELLKKENAVPKRRVGGNKWMSGITTTTW